MPDPVFFLVFAADLIVLIERLGLTPQLYADNTQIFGVSSLFATCSERTNQQ